MLHQPFEAFKNPLNACRIDLLSLRAAHVHGQLEWFIHSLQAIAIHRCPRFQRGLQATQGGPAASFLLSYAASSIVISSSTSPGGGTSSRELIGAFTKALKPSTWTIRLGSASEFTGLSQQRAIHKLSRPRKWASALLRASSWTCRLTSRGRRVKAKCLDVSNTMHGLKVDFF